MKNPSEPVVGAVGFEIFVETKLDLATATDIKIHYTKPSGGPGYFVGTSATKDSPRSQTKYGALYITTAPTDLDEAGDWTFQVEVTMPAFSGRGKETEVIEVLAAK